MHQESNMVDKIYQDHQSGNSQPFTHFLELCQFMSPESTDPREKLSPFEKESHNTYML